MKGPHLRAAALWKRLGEALDDRTTGVEALEAEIRGAQYDVLADAAHFLMHFDDRCGRLLLERAYRILDGK